MALELRYLEHMNDAEVAQALRCNTNTATQRIRRALEKLRKRLGARMAVALLLGWLGETAKAEEAITAPPALDQWLTNALHGPEAVTPLPEWKIKTIHILERVQAMARSPIGWMICSGIAMTILAISISAEEPNEQKNVTKKEEATTEPAPAPTTETATSPPIDEQKAAIAVAKEYLHCLVTDKRERAKKLLMPGATCEGRDPFEISWPKTDEQRARHKTHFDTLDQVAALRVNEYLATFPNDEVEKMQKVLSSWGVREDDMQVFFYNRESVEKAAAAGPEFTAHALVFFVRRGENASRIQAMDDGHMPVSQFAKVFDLSVSAVATEVKEDALPLVTEWAEVEKRLRD